MQVHILSATSGDVKVDEAISVDPGFSIGALHDVLEDRTEIPADTIQLSHGEEVLGQDNRSSAITQASKMAPKSPSHWSTRRRTWQRW